MLCHHWTLGTYSYIEIDELFQQVRAYWRRERIIHYQGTKCAKGETHTHVDYSSFLIYFLQIGTAEDFCSKAACPLIVEI